MLNIALTGGICSGKSTVADRFRHHDIDVISADAVAHEIMQPGQAVYQSVLETFGEALRLPDGSIDRPRLREIVFAEPGQRKALEAITHPAIRERMTELARLAKSTYLVQEIPLLTETGGKDRFDRILVVTCETDIRMRRLMHQRGIGETVARNILRSQASDEDRLAIADDVIENNSDIPTLERNVDRLHRIYLELANA